MSGLLHELAFEPSVERPDLLRWSCSCGERSGAFLRERSAQHAAARHLTAVVDHPDAFDLGYRDGRDEVSRHAHSAFPDDRARAAYYSGLRAGRRVARR